MGMVATSPAIVPALKGNRNFVARAISMCLNLVPPYIPFEVRQSSAMISIYMYPTYIKTSENDAEVDGHSHHADSSSENNSHMHDDMQMRSIVLPIPQQRG